MMLLRAAGALLMVVCGWCAGDAVQSGTAAHEAAVRSAAQLLRRIRGEIAYNRGDLGSLYKRLCREGVLAGGGGSLQTIAPPGELTGAEAACFADCVAGLGRTQAQRECERLDYYIARFDVFLQAAHSQTQKSSALTHRLGLAAGAVLALIFI